MPCYQPQYSWINGLSNNIHGFILLLNLQSGQGLVGRTGLCYQFGQLQGWGLESLQVFLIHMPVSWARKVQTAGAWNICAFLGPSVCGLSSRSLQNGSLGGAIPWDSYDVAFSHTASFPPRSVDGGSRKAPSRLRGRDHRSHLSMKVSQSPIVRRSYKMG